MERTGEFPALERAAYRHWTALDTRFSDLDALGHVNHARIATYIETGRVAIAQEAGLLLPGAERLVVIVRLEIDYRAEVMHPHRLDIGTRVLRQGNSSFDLAAAIFVPGAESPAATARAICVTLDPTTRRSAAMPPRLREVLSLYA